MVFQSLNSVQRWVCENADVDGIELVKTERQINKIEEYCRIHALTLENVRVHDSHGYVGWGLAKCRARLQPEQVGSTTPTSGNGGWPTKILWVLRKEEYPAPELTERDVKEIRRIKQLKNIQKTVQLNAMIPFYRTSVQLRQKVAQVEFQTRRV